MSDEWINELIWFPPYHKHVVRLNKFYDVSKGRIVIVEITEKPENLDGLKAFIDYRKENGLPITAFRTYLTQIRKYAVGVVLYENNFPVFITTDTYDVYVKRTWKSRSQYMRGFLRHLLYYSGYKLRYKYTRCKGYRFKPTEQQTLYVLPNNG